MAKKLIRLTESDLHRIVKESVKRILREEDRDDSIDDWQNIYSSYYDSGLGNDEPDNMAKKFETDMAFAEDDYRRKKLRGIGNRMQDEHPQVNRWKR